jgi:hypothetical protein
MLDLIAGALRAEGIPFVRVDGKSSAKARKEAIQAFAGEATVVKTMNAQQLKAPASFRRCSMDMAAGCSGFANWLCA